MKIGDIYVPTSIAANGRLAHCRVDNVGKNAAEKTGIKPGDYVMIDRLATFAWTVPTAALKFDSVICITNEKKTDFWPLKDRAFIIPDQKDDISNVGGIYVKGYSNRLNTGTITKTNFDKTTEYPFEVGQHVMLVKGGDVIEVAGNPIHVFSKDMIVCVVEDK